jgi:hypothetical protein
MKCPYAGEKNQQTNYVNHDSYLERKEKGRRNGQLDLVRFMLPVGNLTSYDTVDM